MIVVDASVLADALVDDGTVGDVARAALLDDVHWAAPAHLVVEVVSVFRGKVLGGKLDIRRGRQATQDLQELTIDLVDPLGLVERMWELRGSLTSYDAAYVAAAERLGCVLVTSDARLGSIRGLRCSIRTLDTAAHD